jgi:hypothetical protein
MDAKGGRSVEHVASCLLSLSRLIRNAYLDRTAPSDLRAVAPTLPFSRARAFRETTKEKIMNPTRIPGNEPDPGDMSTEPGTRKPNENPGQHDLPDDAEKLGDFA